MPSPEPGAFPDAAQQRGPLYDGYAEVNNVRTPRFTVEIYHDIVPYLAGISTRAFFQDTDLLIAAWKIATEWTLDTFHGRLKPRTPSAAPNSYGHLLCLGAPLRQPEYAEPNIAPVTDSLCEAIRLLEAARGMDYTACPVFRQYAEASKRVRAAFPDAPLLGGLGVEGPITSSALFMGEAFYMDALEQPEETQRFLSLMTDSIIAFKHQVNAFMGRPPIEPGGTWLADDLASMLPPHLWDRLVVPSWRRFRAGTTSGERFFVHCEAVVPAQLPFLERAGVTFYQPSVSPKLTLNDMRGIGLPFDWLLYAYHVTDMKDAAIQQWVVRAAQAGAQNIRTQLGAYIVSINKVDRIHAFLDAADSFSLTEVSPG